MWQTDGFELPDLQNGLRIDGTGEIIGKSYPLTIITGDHSYEMTVHVTCCEGCEAGPILQYKRKFIMLRR